MLKDNVHKEIESGIYIFNDFFHETGHVHRQRLGPTNVEIQGVKMLTRLGGMCCDGFINLAGVVAGVQRQ
jgi:hypothetical protein